MEQSPSWEADRFSASQEISRIYGTRRFNTAFTPWSKVLLEKLTCSQLVKKFPVFMEPEGSIPHSQVPATCLCPVPDRSLHAPTSHIVKIHLNITLQVPVPIRDTCVCCVTMPVFTARSCQHLAQPPHAGGPPLLGCLRLLIQDIRRPFLHPQPEDAPYRGDRDPLLGKRTYLMSTMKIRGSTTGSGNSLLQTMQPGCGTHSAPNPRGTVSCFPEAKRTDPVAATCA